LAQTGTKPKIPFRRNKAQIAIKRANPTPIKQATSTTPRQTLPTHRKLFYVEQFEKQQDPAGAPSFPLLGRVGFHKSQPYFVSALAFLSRINAVGA
jgi:hypothetical protein